MSYSTSFGNDSPGFTRCWFDCMRTRKPPHCTVDDGFAHSVAWTMAAESYWTGKRLHWDAAREEILDRPPRPVSG